MVNDILEMVSENAFNQSSILSAVNGARALCLNEILIANSLGGGRGATQSCFTFYAAIRGKYYGKIIGYMINSP